LEIEIVIDQTQMDFPKLSKHMIHRKFRNTVSDE